VSRYQKGKTNLDFTEARDSEWQWHQLGHMQVCTSLQTDNHGSTPPLSFYRPDALLAAQPTLKAMKEIDLYTALHKMTTIIIIIAGRSTERLISQSDSSHATSPFTSTVQSSVTQCHMIIDLYTALHKITNNSSRPQH